MRLFKLFVLALFISVPLSVGCNSPEGGTVELGDAEVDPAKSTDPEPEH